LHYAQNFLLVCLRNFEGLKAKWRLAPEVSLNVTYLSRECVDYAS
jgi:hypothetical protein